MTKNLIGKNIAGHPVAHTVGAIIFENRFEGIAQPKMHQFEKYLCLSCRGGHDNSETFPTYSN